MSYTPTNWKAGDVVTSAKLNKLEDGVAAAGGVLVVALSGEQTTTADKTADEIWAAAQSGSVVFNMAEMGMLMPLMHAALAQTGYTFYFGIPAENELRVYGLTAATAADYPSITMGG